MKKSKTAIILVLIVAVLSWGGCGSSVQNTNAVQETAKETESQTHSLPVEESVPEPEVEEAVPDINIDWKSIECSWEEADGYRYRATVKISPWILQSNTPVIHAAWDEVGNGNILPTIHDFGLHENQSDSSFWAQFGGIGSAGRDYYAYVTDMYYAVGEVSFDNITEGWDLSETNQRGLYFSLNWPYDFSDDGSVYNTATHVVGKVFYSSEVSVTGGAAFVKPQMTGNHWGPATFVLAHAENITPKTPNGVASAYLKNGYLIVREGDPNLFGGSLTGQKAVDISWCEGRTDAKAVQLGMYEDEAAE